MEDDQAVIEEVATDGVRDLVEALQDREDLDASVRMIVRFEGEEYDLAYVRDDVDDRYTDAEMRRRIETLVMKGLGDPPQEQALYDFGPLRATIRWFDEVACAYFPDGEWTGVIVVLDRIGSPVMDLAFEHIVE